MKTPHKESLQERMLAVEMATDAALRAEFDLHSCDTLTDRLSTLWNLLLDEDDELPVVIDDEKSPIAKVLVMVDVAFCCWRNDNCEVVLPDDVLLTHIARMKLNPKHCRTVLDFTRMFLKTYDRLLSVESASLLIHE